MEKQFTLKRTLKGKIRSHMAKRVLKIFFVLLVFLKLASKEALAQTRLEGTVKDNAGHTLIGVIVKIKNTDKATTTNADGKFVIASNSGKDTVIFSYLGYMTQEIAAVGKNSFDVILQPNSTVLGDVLIIGYGSQKKSDLTGAVSSVSANQISKRPVFLVQQALQGESSGVSVTSNSGQPGAAPTVRIRGANSINGGNDPLYVIDGYIGGSITSVNVNDIQSIEVLKDASATAIYGSRGANGVILISTKTGKAGDTKINFNAWLSQNQLPKKLNLLNAYDFATTVNAQTAILTPAAPAPFSVAQLDNFKTTSTDWQSELSHKTYAKNYQIDVSGGTADYKYLISGNYLEQPGLIINSAYQRYTLRANLEMNLNSKMNLRVDLSGLQANGHNNNYTGVRNDPFSQATVWDPTSPVRNVQGMLINKSSYASIQNSPIAEILNVSNDSKFSDYIGTGILNIKIIQDLTFTSNSSIETQSQYNPGYQGAGSSVGLGQTPPSGIGSLLAVKYSNYQTSNFLTYNKKINPDNLLTITALYEQQHRENTSTTTTSSKIFTDALSYYGLALGSSISDNTGYSAETITSYLGRINYSYKNKYLLTLSARSDGSSKFTSANRFSFFPSAAIAWRVTEEPFFKKQTLFNNFKVRASYGRTGNQGVNPYSFQSLLSASGNYYLNGGVFPVAAVALGAPASSNLQWEKTAAADAGVDIEMFKGRLSFTADIYHKKTTDLLLAVNIPQYIGGGSFLNNVGSVENTGLEFSVSGNPLHVGSFNWNSSFNITINHNKVLDLGGTDNITIGIAGQNIGLLKVGQPLGQFFGYQYLGTWKSDQATEAALYNAKPGDARYLDIDGNHIYNSADYANIGNGQPKFYFGFSNDFTYKSLALNVFFQGAQDFDIFSSTLGYTFGGQGDARHATNSDILNRWTPANQTDIPAFSTTANNPLNSSRFIYKGNYIKLKNVNLTYHFPSALLEKVNARSLDIYLSGQNLFTLTKFSGYDPEASGNLGNDTAQGGEYGVIPNPRTYTLGIRLGF